MLKTTYNNVNSKVSVIVPVYGVEKYIARCARSLFAQTLDDIEYLFIDDCTPDKSIEILRQVLDEYPNRKPQVKIHRMDKNSGQAAVRRWGMQNVSGEYVIHCDSDDWIDVDMYRVMYEKAVENDADVVICDYYECSDSGYQKKCSESRSDSAEGVVEHMLYHKTTWNLWNKLFRRIRCYKGLIYPVSNMGEDMVLCIQSMMRVDKIVYITNPYYYYSVNIGSITRPIKKSLDKCLFDYISTKNNVEIIRNILFNHTNGRLREGVVSIEFEVIEKLFPLSHRNEYRHLCFYTYKAIVRRVLLSPEISFKRKIKILLAKLYLFPTRV